MKDQLELVQQALEKSPDPLFLLDRAGKVIFWNRACEDFTGCKKADLLQTNLHRQVFYPQSSPPHPTLADLLLTGRQNDLAQLYPEKQKPQIIGDRLCAEGWYSNLGGQDRYITFTAVPLYDRAGTLVAALESFHDISDRRRAEEKMAALLAQISQAKRQWEETMDQIDDLVLVADATGAIQRCNRSVIDLLGLSYAEVLQTEWRSLMQEKGMNFTPQDAHRGECYYPATDRWFFLKSYDFRGEAVTGKPWSVITLLDRTEARRITKDLEQAHAELKMTQAQMLQSEKMAAIGQLAAGVAHEINNPISFVKSNLMTLGRYVNQLAAFIAKQEEAITQLGGDRAPDVLAQLRKQSKLEFILEDVADVQNESLEGIERVRKIVQDLKSFSRVDQADRQRVDLNECIESALSIVFNELKFKATIEKDLAQLPKILCYPQQINQVLLNLLINAGDAIQETGIIRTKSWQEGALLCLSISDTGSGIAAENLSRVFDPFFTTKEVGKGTGLGLSISYDIIKKHGGEMRVESRLGHGTTFTLLLPQKPSPQ